MGRMTGWLAVIGVICCLVLLWFLYFSVEGGGWPFGAGQRAERCCQCIRRGDIASTESYLRSHPELVRAAVAGQPLLCWAAREGSPEMVGLLLRYGADVNERDSMGQTALHNAAMRGHAKAVETLLRAGADTEVKDDEGFRAIDWARGKPEIERLLVGPGGSTGGK